MGEKYWKEVFDCALMKEGSSFIQFLLDAGLDVNALNKYGTTMLSYAAESGNLELAKFLVQKGADTHVANSDGSEPFHVATQSGRRDMVCFILDIMIYGEVCDNDKVPWRCVKTKSDFLPVSRDVYQNIVNACKRGSLETVQYYLSNGHDLSAESFEGSVPLFMAARYKHSGIVEYLIECGVDVNCDDVGWTVLHYACEAGWLEVVESLMKKECDINARTVSNSTPLHLAAERGNLEIVKHLLISGADCNAEDIRGKTALSMFIKKYFCLEVITLFLRNGAYFQAEDYAIICSNRFLKKGILQNIQLCTMALVNKFNYADLHKIYEIPGVSARFPQIERLKIVRRSTAQDIAESVKYEIQTKGYCNILNVCPIVLSRLCVLSLTKN